MVILCVIQFMKSDLVTTVKPLEVMTNVKTRNTSIYGVQNNRTQFIYGRGNSRCNSLHCVLSERFKLQKK